MRSHILVAAVGAAALGLCPSASATRHAARSVTVHFVNQTTFTLTLTKSGFTESGYGKWVTAPPHTIAPHGNATWKSESSKFMKGVGGYADFRVSAPNNGTVHTGWDNPYVGGNSYSYNAPAGLQLEKSGGTGNDTTVTFTLSPPFSLPKNTKVTSLKVRVLTASDMGSGTDDDVYFDIGPMGWLLDKPHYNDFERNSDDTYDLDLSGVNLNTDDIIHARLQKKGIGGWTGAPDGVGGAWKAQSMHFIVNGVDSGKIDVNQWFDSKHEFWTHKLQSFDPYETFIRTLRMTANPELTKSSENIAILTTPFKEMGLSGWMGSDVGTVTAIGTIVYTPGQSTDGLATIDMKLESIHLSKNNKTYVFEGKNKTPGINGPRYLRTEYKFRKFGAFTGGKPLPDKGDRVSISGPIFVDTDHEGYYEIHPDKPAQVAILPKS